MKKVKVFIDGEVGTTGLKIRDRIESRQDVEVLKIADELRKDARERGKFLNAADFVFLCLPDDAARESISLIQNDDVRVIDASTAHRVHPDWTYGFPELSAEQTELIRRSKRVSVPGCYATGFVALIRPLTDSGVIPRDCPISCFGISGYSGAGKAAIAEYERDYREPELSGARMYALSLEHKHLPEMRIHGGLTEPPLFIPIIDDFYSGMLVSVHLHGGFGKGEIISVYRERYKNSGRVKLVEDYDEDFLAANKLSESDDMEIFVFGDSKRLLLTARLDNLGKGSSGAAVQCFEIMKDDEQLTVDN